MTALSHYTRRNVLAGVASATVLSVLASRDSSAAGLVPSIRSFNFMASQKELEE
ncbi:hypothetical protein U8Q06_12350 [Rhizobium beringeri]|uniref:hypothetical protein n=1 Tax=Rhizobium TaxID=379 RepID=UPI0013EEE4A5|nr:MULTISPECIES: hypothetical protein [Rhizobium]WSH53322.1 hypothetical protein U8Q06_12350 [Rhizobium beringeri]